MDGEFNNIVNVLNNLDSGVLTWNNVNAVNSVITTLTVTNITITALTVGGNIAMGGFKLTGLGAGTVAGDSLRYEQVIGLYLLLTGGTMSGAIAMGTNKITGLGNGTAAQDAVAFSQLISNNIVGTATNDNATAGNIGQYIQSVVSRSTPVTASANGTYFDITSISLTAGDWEVSLTVGLIPATTQTGYEIGIGTTTGNSAAGMAYGENQLQINTTGLGAALDDGMSIPGYRVSIASTTTYFAKGLGFYSLGTPKFYGRLSARRMR